MAQSRSSLQTKLSSIAGVVKAYYQPDKSLSLKYPCIVYRRTGRFVNRADNGVYTKYYEYQVTVIDRAPDSPIAEVIEDYKFCEMGRQITQNSLYHSNFTLYY